MIPIYTQEKVSDVCISINGTSCAIIAKLLLVIVSHHNLLLSKEIVPHAANNASRLNSIYAAN